MSTDLGAIFLGNLRFADFTGFLGFSFLFRQKKRNGKLFFLLLFCGKYVKIFLIISLYCPALCARRKRL